ncbi:MAG: hypothetical protein GEU94_10965 [Micromonosporaceae bacterium]|nr:hypothetical protein [Micromonosporaceae bacterium]
MTYSRTTDSPAPPDRTTPDRHSGSVPSPRHPWQSSATPPGNSAAPLGELPDDSEVPHRSHDDSHGDHSDPAHRDPTHEDPAHGDSAADDDFEAEDLPPPPTDFPEFAVLATAGARGGVGPAASRVKDSSFGVIRDGPPPRIMVTAVICGLLAVPMLAGAGSLTAQTFAGKGAVSALSAALAIALLAAAGVNLAGAVHLVQRGSPRLAQLGGYLTIGLTALSITAMLLGSSPATAVVVALVLLAPAVAMLTLLNAERPRRWAASRGRHHR